MWIIQLLQIMVGICLQLLLAHLYLLSSRLLITKAQHPQLPDRIQLRSHSTDVCRTRTQLASTQL